MAAKQRVALVLSSGGARGLAHIGVIEKLQEEGYEISSIAGSSIGAVVGAYYACGKLDVYKKWVCDLDRFDVFSLFDFTFSTSGFIKGEKLFKVLAEIIEDREIDKLPIPFAAVATDINHQKEVVFKSGSMYEALRASTAIPTILLPVQRGEQLLIDGAVISPIPMNAVDRTNADKLVVVNVNANIPYERTQAQTTAEQKILDKKYTVKLNAFMEKWRKTKIFSSNTQSKPGFFDLMTRSLDLMQDQLCNVIMQSHKPDLTINISKNACTTFEFYKAKEMIEEGRKAFDRAIEDTSLLPTTAGTASTKASATKSAKA